MANLANIPNLATVERPLGDDVFERFVLYVDVAPKTLSTYKTALRSFVAFLVEQGCRTPSRETVLSYREHLSQSGHKPGTVSLYLRVVKVFFEWTESERIYPNVAKRVKGPKMNTGQHQRDAFTAEEVREIVASIPTDDEQGLRDRAVVILSVTSGLRMVELSRADVEDVERRGAVSWIRVQGKGHASKDARKDLSPFAVEALQAYLTARKAGKGEPLFTSTSNRSRGTRLPAKTLSALIVRRIREAGFDSSRLTAHSLRHTSVTEYGRTGATLQEMQAHARHSDPATTLVYAHNIDQERQLPSRAVGEAIFGDGTRSEVENEIKLTIAALDEDELREVLECAKEVRRRHDAR